MFYRLEEKVGRDGRVGHLLINFLRYSLRSHPSKKTTSNETVKAAKDLGMRVSTGGIFFDLPGIGGRSHEDYISEADNFYQNHSSDDSVIPAILPHGSYTVSPQNLSEAKSIADQYGILW